MNRSTNRLSIVITNLVWRIKDNSPNSPNFPAIRYITVRKSPVVRQVLFFTVFKLSHIHNCIVIALSVAFVCVCVYHE